MILTILVGIFGAVAGFVAGFLFNAWLASEDRWQ